MKRVSDSFGRRGREVVGVILLCSGLLLALALISYDPRDLGALKEGLTAPAPVSNLTGKVGAVVSELLFWTLGTGSFLIPFVVLLYALRLLLERDFRFRAGELVGFGAFIICSSSLMALKFKYVTLMGSQISAGGMVGLTSGLLVNLFNVTGSYIILIAALVISALATSLLSLDRVGEALSWAGSITVSAFASLAERRRQARLRGRGPRSRARVRADEANKETHIRMPARQPEVRQEEFPFLSTRKEFQLPTLSMLESPAEAAGEIDKDLLLRDSRILEKKLSDFGVEGKVTEVQPGPVITLFEFSPAPGVKINRIVNLTDDLALALRAVTVRIVAPIPGKAAVGVEVPNVRRQTVFLREILSSPQFADDSSPLKLAMGKEMTGRPFSASLTDMPHLLIAGSTGAGKSIFINCALMSILYQATPSEVKLILIDPKRLELSPYEGIPHLLLPVIFDPKKAAQALKWAVEEMEQRYALMTTRGAKHIENYNRILATEKSGAPAPWKTGDDTPIPYLVIIIDELADLMMTAARDVENSIARLAQMARAAGIHLILATQRPSVDVLTGLIKANFPARISFQFPSKVDSRTILDASGAEHLLGKGDMLYLAPGTAQLIRLHGCYVSEGEIKKVVEFLKRQGAPDYERSLTLPKLGEQPEPPLDTDDRYDEAVALVLETGQVSISMIQRRLRIGFNRAARIIERMEAEGLVTKPEAGKPREILIHRRG